MGIFKELEAIILCPHIEEKALRFHRLYRGAPLAGQVFDWHHPVREFKKPSYASFCQVVEASKVPRRKKEHTAEGRRVFLHAICHIEYSAFDLALDAVYRYRHLPLAYYLDWLTVAAEELYHFSMLRRLLLQEGGDYGDYPVHDGLFKGAMACRDVLERMAVVPRYQEANGLEANLKIISRLKGQGLAELGSIVEALEIIYKDEIGHVSLGNKWFRYFCRQQNLSHQVFFEILNKHFPARARRPVDHQARLAAGFTAAEIRQLESPVETVSD